MTAPPILRPYQSVVVDQVGTEIAAGHRTIVVVAPTGSGKTVIASRIIETAVSARQHVLFLAHRRELVSQASGKLHAAGVSHGIIQAGFPTRPGERIQVASVQTLCARAVRTSKIEMPPADLVLVDEAHHARAQSYQRILAVYPDAKVIGLTATPCRGDGRGLGNIFTAMVQAPPVAELTNLGFLVPATYYAPTRPDLLGVHIRHGDYVEAELAERMNTPKLVGDVVTHWLRLNPQRRQTIVFATGVKHSVHLRDQFRAAGVMAEHIDGGTASEERDDILRRLRQGIVEVVTNCMVLTEGFDAPDVGCLVLARPTKSLGLYMQMAGRALRPAPGKTDALILDHAAAVFEHGFVDDPIDWTLDADRRAANSAQSSRAIGRHPGLTTCPECSAVRQEGKPCVVCGWQPRVKGRGVEFADGDLGKVDRDRKVVRRDFNRHEMTRFYAQLVWIAQERGYKAGWASHKYKEKFGRWPDLRNVAPIRPDLEVRSWVKSRQIAWAKSRQVA